MIELFFLLLEAMAAGGATNCAGCDGQSGDGVGMG